MPGPVTKLPTTDDQLDLIGAPSWLKPENASVFDPPWRASMRDAVRLVRQLTGADDPKSQVIAGAALENPQELGGVVKALADKFPRLANAIKAWHGSPHEFAPEENAPLGRFDPTKIGTGEGAQAYGHGHYLAEREGVAQSYKNVLGKGAGKMYEVNIHADPEHFLDWDKPLRDQSPYVKERMTGAVTPPKPTDKMTRKELINILQQVDRNGVWTDADALREFGQVNSLADLRGIAKQMDIDEYLSVNLANSPHTTGHSLYRQQTTRAGGGDQLSSEGAAQASEALRQRGIAGIRYLDNASRKADEYVLTMHNAEGRAVNAFTFPTEAEARAAVPAIQKQLPTMQLTPQIAFNPAPPPTHNYVVFPGNEHLMEILKKYGLLLPMAGMGAAAAQDKGPQ